jgi:dynamin-binding protein
MRPIYGTYITRHSLAANHFANLTAPATVSPAITAYLTTTRTLTTPHTTAWDIPSLLIKPVQRLLKYPLLLNSIIEDTPAEHGDRAHLLEAREKLEALARSVNEQARRRELVKAVLEARGAGGVAGLLAKPKGASSPAQNAPAPPSLTATKMRSFKSKLKTTILPGEPTSSLEQDRLGHQQLLLWEKRMKASEKVCNEFARNVMEWSRQQSTVIRRLGEWNKSFGRVSLGDPVVYQAVTAFAEVIASLDVLWQDLVSPSITSMVLFDELTLENHIGYYFANTISTTAFDPP